MGAVRLAELCQELESDAKDKSPEDITNWSLISGGEFDDVRQVYEDERQHALTH